MLRVDAIKSVLDRVGDAPIISNLGGTTFHLHNLSDRDANLYTWGAMGLASSIGLGVALAAPDRKVVVMDGDGSLLMNLGSLGTIARQSPRNLVHLVWDNHQWAGTGGQPTHTAGGDGPRGGGSRRGDPEGAGGLDAGGAGGGVRPGDARGRAVVHRRGRRGQRQPGAAGGLDRGEPAALPPHFSVAGAGLLTALGRSAVRGVEGSNRERVGRAISQESRPIGTCPPPYLRRNMT